MRHIVPLNIICPSYHRVRFPPLRLFLWSDIQPPPGSNCALRTWPVVQNSAHRPKPCHKKCKALPSWIHSRRTTNGRLILVEHLKNKPNCQNKTLEFDLQSVPPLLVPFYQPLNKLIATIQSPANFKLAGSCLTFPAQMIEIQYLAWFVHRVTAAKLKFTVPGSQMSILGTIFVNIFPSFMFKAVSLQSEFIQTEFICSTKLICKFLSMHNTHCMKCHWNITAWAAYFLVESVLCGGQDAVNSDNNFINFVQQVLLLQRGVSLLPKGRSKVSRGAGLKVKHCSPTQNALFTAALVNTL